MAKKSHPGFPLSIRKIKPSGDAVLLTGKRPDGLPDGFHTGGAYHIPDPTGRTMGSVWKPLDAIPFSNAEYTMPTFEDKALEALHEIPLFPKNWEVTEKNGRRWLVRDWAVVLGQQAKPSGYSMQYTELSIGDILKVEQSVRAANHLGWGINDAITLAFDLSRYELFILDLSNAYNSKPIFWNDDAIHITTFMKWCGRAGERILMLRENARLALSEFRVRGNPDNLDPEIRDRYPGADLNLRDRFQYEHVYASFNRPISTLWATLPPDCLFHHNFAVSWKSRIPHTWIFTIDPLPQECIERYELEWGCSPVFTKKEREQVQKE